MDRNRVIKRAVASPILRNNGLFFVSTAIVGLAGYLLNTTAARRFAPGNYSQLGVALTLSAMFLPVNAALVSAVMRQASLNRVGNATEQTVAVQRTLVRYLTLFSLVALGVIAIAGGTISRFFRLTMVTPLYFVVIIAYWQFVQGLLQATLQEEGRYGRICTSFLSEGIFRAVVGITVIVIGFGMNLTLAVYALSTVIAVVLLPRPLLFWTGKGVLRKTLMPIYRDMGPLTLANCSLSFLTMLDVVLSRRYLDPVTADHYVAIAAMAKFFLFATNSVSSIAFAEIVRAMHHGKSTLRLLGTSLVLLLGLGIPFVLFCTLFGSVVTTFAFGESFRTSGHLLWITSLTAVAMSLLNLEITYFNARHWVRYLPVLLLGSAATIAALPLAHHSLRRYAGIYAFGTTALVLILLVPLIVIIVRDEKDHSPHPSDGGEIEDRLTLSDAATVRAN